MAPLRVLWISTAYPADEEDPRGIFIRTMARALVDAGVELTVLAPSGPHTVENEVWEGVRLVRARYWFKRRQGLAVGVSGIAPNLRARPLLLFQLPTLLIALCWHAVRLARETDLVHAHWLYPSGLAGALVALVQRKPFVVSTHGGDLNLADRVPILRLLSRAVVRRASSCVAVSHDLARKLAALGAREDRVHVIAYGVDRSDEVTVPSTVACTAAYRRLASSSSFKILYVGSLIPRKSVDTLLSAVALLQRRGISASTTVVGAGPAEAELRQLATASGLQDVTFVGQQPPAAIVSWMKAADVLVLPSLSEGRPVVVLQAMAAGLPVVASDIPGTRDLVAQDQTGFLFPARSPEGLAECLAKAHDDPEARIRVARAASAAIEAKGLFTDEIARRHIGIYRDVLTADRARDGLAPSARPLPARSSLLARRRSILLPVAVLLFAGASTMAYRRIPDVSISAKWLAALAALGPFTMLLNAVEYMVAGRIVRQRIPFGEAVRIAILSSAANLLPIPGAAVVRTRALKQGGSGYAAAFRSYAAVGVGWVGTALLLAGLLQIRAGAQWVGLMATAGGLLACGAMVTLMRSAPRKMALALSVIGVETLFVMVAAARIYTAARGVGLTCSITQAVALTVAAAAASAVGVFPAGLGLRELLAALASPVIGLSAAVGVVSVAIDRLVGLAVLGIVSVFVLWVSRPKMIGRQERRGE